MGNFMANPRALHVITVDPDGVPLDPTTYQKLSAQDFEKQLDGIELAIKASSKKSILLFVHGGLNNREASQRHVDTLLPPMEADGYYAVFLNWNSDLLDTAREDLLYIRQGREARILGPLSSPLALLMALGTGLLRAPLVWGQMISSDLNGSGLHNFPGKVNSQALQGEWLRLWENRDPAAVPIGIGDDHTSGWASVAASFRYAATFPAKLVLSPLIDGVGKGAWRNMLRRTQMLFHREDEFDVRDKLGAEKGPDARRDLLVSGPQGAAYRLFERLQTYVTQHPDVGLTLIGHSMGTIVLNRALREFPVLRVRNIVYMAAACSIDEFRTSVLPYLTRHDEAFFYNLTLHPSTEVGEWQVGLFDLTPRGSLLVWIDNFLSDPATTLDRTLGSWENLMQTAHVIPVSVRPRVTLKAFGIDAEASRHTTPRTHGGFTDPRVRFWCPDVWEVPGHKPRAVPAMSSCAR